MSNKEKDFRITKFNEATWSMFCAYGKMFEAPKRHKYGYVDEFGCVYTVERKPKGSSGGFILRRGSNPFIAGFVEFKGDWRKSVVKLEKINLNAVFRNNGIQLKFWS